MRSLCFANQETHLNARTVVNVMVAIVLGIGVVCVSPHKASAQAKLDRKLGEATMEHFWKGRDKLRSGLCRIDCGTEGIGPRRLAFDFDQGSIRFDQNEEHLTRLVRTKTQTLFFDGEVPSVTKGGPDMKVLLPNVEPFDIKLAGLAGHGWLELRYTKAKVAWMYSPELIVDVEQESETAVRIAWETSPPKHPEFKQRGTVWFDPKRDYVPTRVESREFYDGPRGKFERVEATSDTDWEQRGDCWVPTRLSDWQKGREGKFVMTMKWEKVNEKLPESGCMSRFVFMRLGDSWRTGWFD